MVCIYFIFFYAVLLWSLFWNNNCNLYDANDVPINDVMIIIVNLLYN